MDSIRENRTKEDFVAELGLLFNEDIDGSLCVVLVEGTDDVRFMENLLEDNVVCEEVPYGGKHGIDDIMKMEDPVVQKKEVIAIRDKDYIEVTQLPDRVFLYDGCCLETMILMNCDIAEEFYKKNYNGCFEKDAYLVNIMRHMPESLKSSPCIVKENRIFCKYFLSSIVQHPDTLIHSCHKHVRRAAGLQHMKISPYLVSFNDTPVHM